MMIQTTLPVEDNIKSTFMSLNISANQSMSFSVGYVGHCQIDEPKRAGNIEKIKLHQKFLRNILSIVLEVPISLAPPVEIKNIIFNFKSIFFKS